MSVLLGPPTSELRVRRSFGEGRSGRGGTGPVSVRFRTGRIGGLGSDGAHIPGDRVSSPFGGLARCVLLPVLDMNSTPANHRRTRMRTQLERMMDALVTEARVRLPDLEEGRVMTVGPPPYRRLDCDGRALAYLRARPRRVAVRLDISGLWLPPRTSPLLIPSSVGAALLLERRDDVELAVVALVESVERTRAYERRAA